VDEELTYRSGTDRPAPFAPQRVVCLAPPISESLADLALSDRVIAVTDDAMFPAGGFPAAERLGPSSNPDIGRLIELAPDLVLLDQRHGRIRERLEEAGSAVWLAEPQTVRGTFNLLWDLMNYFEQPQMVARVRALEWTADWLERLGETRPRPARVLALLERDPLRAVAGASYASDLLRLCGGESVFAASPFPALELDGPEIPDAQPDVLLLAEGEGAFSEQDVIDLMALDTPASQRRRVHLIDGTMLTWAGTRVARALDLLPNLFDMSSQGGEEHRGSAVV